MNKKSFGKIASSGLMAASIVFAVPANGYAATNHGSRAVVKHSAKVHAADVVWQDEWRITSVGRTYYSYPVAWQNCQQIYASNLSGTATCEASKTLSASVSGNVGVDSEDVSAAVGFSVTASYTLSSSRTFNIPTHTAGWLKWRPTYIARHFTETEYSCTPTGSCVSEGVTRTGTARHYDTWGAQFFKR